jgi:putative endonuclease
VDGWGTAALRSAKRQRLQRAWLVLAAEHHPEAALQTVELVYALVPLPPRRGPMRWIRAGI